MNEQNLLEDADTDEKEPSQPSPPTPEHPRRRAKRSAGCPTGCNFGSYSEKGKDYCSACGTECE